MLPRRPSDRYGENDHKDRCAYHAAIVPAMQDRLNPACDTLARNTVNEPARHYSRRTLET